MPALGVAQEKGTLLNWRKAEGQLVTKGEPLMEIETDKATVEIEAPASGILANVTASAGDEIPVGNRIAVILAPGEVATPAAVQPHPHPNSFDKSGTGSLPEGEGIREVHHLREQSKGNNHPIPMGEGRDEGRSAVRGRIPASPAARESPEKKESTCNRFKAAGPRGAF